MNLTGLNTPALANLGLGVATASAGTVVSIVTGLEAGAHPPIVEIVVAFAGVMLGMLMCYIGRPSTIPPAPPSVP